MPSRDHIDKLFERGIMQRIVHAHRDLSSQPMPEDPDEKRARAAQLNRYQLILNGYDEEAVAKMSNEQTHNELHSLFGR